jgi:hypothetical protein
MCDRDAGQSLLIHQIYRQSGCSSAATRSSSSKCWMEGFCTRAPPGGCSFETAEWTES